MLIILSQEIKAPNIKTLISSIINNNNRVSTPKL